jgi:hypothetical protein
MKKTITIPEGTKTIKLTINIEPKEVKQAVHCQNEDEFEFLKKEYNVDFDISFIEACKQGCGDVFFMPKAHIICWVDSEYLIDEEGDIAVQYKTYLKQENLTDKYNKSRLAKAKLEYPKGCKYKDAVGNVTRTGSGNLTIDFNDDIRDKMCGHITRNGKWAEKLKPIFRDKDGVGIYEGDNIKMIGRRNLIVSELQIHNNNWRKYSEGYYFLSTQKAAEKWVKEERERREKLKPIELIEGKIYHTKDNEWTLLFRHMKDVETDEDGRYCISYSSIDSEKGFTKEKGVYVSDDEGRTVIQATPKQIKKLVKAEIKNNYYFDIVKLTK